MVLPVSPCNRSRRSIRSPSLALKSLITSVPVSPAFQTKVSPPEPPIRMSLPCPPISVSLPVPPSRMSLPLPPSRVSLPPEPNRMSLPAPPSRVSLPSWAPDTSNAL
ncbi:hypothetical protein D9M72_586640 [compost metagenome]